MFRKRTLTVSRQQHEVEQVLRAHDDILPPKDAASASRFTLNKTVRRLWLIHLRGAPINFRFSGTYRQAEAKTEVTYTVFPGASTYFLVLLLALLPISALTAGGSLPMLFGIIIVDLAFWGIVILAKNISIRNFEDLLAGKSSWDS